MRTRLTEILGIEHPVMLAGMGGVSYHRLAAAVSEAGGFGCLGASTMSGPQMVGIHELVPAGELVQRFVAEADAAIGRTAELAGARA